jgi:hypothetical protein
MSGCRVHWLARRRDGRKRDAARRSSVGEAQEARRNERGDHVKGDEGNDDADVAAALAEGNVEVAEEVTSGA